MEYLYILQLMKSSMWYNKRIVIVSQSAWTIYYLPLLVIIHDKKWSSLKANVRYSYLLDQLCVNLIRKKLVNLAIFKQFHQATTTITYSYFSMYCLLSITIDNVSMEYLYI